MEKVMELFRQWLKEAEEEKKNKPEKRLEKERKQTQESKQRIKERRDQRRKDRIKRLTIEYLAYQRLLELKNPYKTDEIISFADTFSKICTIFHLSRDEAFMVLRQMQKEGMIEIVPFKGIRI